MARDWHSKKNTPEWYANYDRVFPPKRKRAEPDEPHEPSKTSEEIDAELRRAFPFCPYTRKE